MVWLVTAKTHSPCSRQLLLRRAVTDRTFEARGRKPAGRTCTRSFISSRNCKRARTDMVCVRTLIESERVSSGRFRLRVRRSSVTRTSGNQS